MNKNNAHHRLAPNAKGIAVLVMAAFMAAQNGRADVTSGFDPANGTYSAGTDVAGKSDASLGGTWGALFSSPTGTVTSSTTSPFNGTLSINVNDTTTASAIGAQIQATNTASLLTSPFTLSFALDVFSGGVSPSIQLYFGNSTIGNNSDWARFSYNSVGEIQMITGDGVGTYTAVNLAAYTTLSDLGSYVQFQATIDPATHKYTNVTLIGTKTTLDVTSLALAVNGGGIPYDGTTPGTYLSVLSGSAATGSANFDAFSITAAPEPPTVLLLGLGAGLIAFLGFVRRRKNLRPVCCT